MAEWGKGTQGNEMKSGRGVSNDKEGVTMGVMKEAAASDPTFAKSLRGIVLHAEVVDQHDGQMLLHIARHQVPCRSYIFVIQLGIQPVDAAAAKT